MGGGGSYLMIILLKKQNVDVYAWNFKSWLGEKRATQIQVSGFLFQILNLSSFIRAKCWL